MDEQGEYDKILKEIEEKLEKNPQLKEEMKNNISRIEDILGHQIEISIIYAKGMEDWMGKFEQYSKDDVMPDLDLSEAMTLGEFISFIKDEEHDLKVSIDPIYLDKGINVVSNVLTTSIDDKVIIVPKTLEENE